MESTEEIYWSGGYIKEVKENILKEIEWLFNMDNQKYKKCHDLK